VVTAASSPSPSFLRLLLLLAPLSAGAFIWRLYLLAPLSAGAFSCWRL
jgi:hypothetical protein